MPINSLVISVIAASIEFILCLMCCIKLWRHRKEGDRPRMILAVCSFLCVMTSLVKFIDLIINDVHYQYSEMHSPYIVNAGVFCQLALFCYPLEMMRPGWFRWRNILLLMSPWIVLTLIQLSGVMHFRPIYSASEMIDYAFEPNVMLRWISIAFYVMSGLGLLFIPYNIKNSSISKMWQTHWVAMVVFIPTFFVVYQFTHILFFHCSHQILIGLFFVYLTHYEVYERLIPPSEIKEFYETEGPSPSTEDSLAAINKKNDLWTRIINTLETNELWKDSDLNLSLFSRLVYSNRTYLAQAFMDNSDMTFTEYIKRKRIEYVASQLEKNPKQNIKNLFFDAGYRSYPTAWRHFKDVIGMLPTEYTATLGQPSGGGKKYGHS